jgi:acyl carrier protein
LTGNPVSGRAGTRGSGARFKWRVGRMQTSDEVLEQIRSALVELFEIEPQRIVLDARLNEDLEIDSIDAVDLLDRLRRQTGRKISADNFRSVRTVGDLVDAVHAVFQA